MRPLLSVVVPVYNQGASVVQNVRTIHERVASRLDGELELVVVSDGSLDRTEAELLENRIDGVRVLSYDRNLGKGYAVKAGALAARGSWIAYCDADLDLDPASIPEFLDVARRDGLDFAIGSKRHPDSRVFYPRSRRLASWMYQQLVRLLFELDVRDTQVGLKVFRAEVAEEVLPLIIVKRFAFDLEFLAVAHALGFTRIRELPVSLDYRFTGSGVRSVAVLRALIDTAAIFYRLRILRYYQRKRGLLGGDRFRRALDFQPRVSIVTDREPYVGHVDYPHVEVMPVPVGAAPETLAEAGRRASGEVVAFLASGARPSGNWLASAVPFLARSEIAAVVVPTVAPHQGSVWQQAAAAVTESRLGGGSLYFRSTPGNLRFVRDFPASNLVARKQDLLAVLADGDVDEDLPRRLAALGKLTLYTPESVVVTRKASLFRPHVRVVRAYARRRALAVRRYGWRGLRPSTLGLLVLPVALVAGAVVAAVGPWRVVGALPWLAYGSALLVAGIAAALRFRSLVVGGLAIAGLVATHVVYVTAFVRAILARA